MKTFILILIIVGGSGRSAIHTQDFYGQESCQAAESVIEKEVPGIYAFCAEKSITK